MTLNKYQRERFADQNLEQVQDRLQDFVRQFEDSEIVGGRLLKDVAVTSGSPAEIPHYLGREPNGVVLVKSTVQLDIWQPTEPTGVFVYVQGSANATVNLWVF